MGGIGRSQMEGLRWKDPDESPPSKAKYTGRFDVRTEFSACNLAKFNWTDSVQIKNWTPKFSISNATVQPLEHVRQIQFFRFEFDCQTPLSFRSKRKRERESSNALSESLFLFDASLVCREKPTMAVAYD